MADEGNGVGKGLLVGFIAGSVVGAILALLYAPKSGEELRSEIKRKTAGLKDQSDEYLRVVKSKAVDAINEGKQRSDRLVSDAKKKAETILGDAERIMSGVREKSGSAVDEGTKIKAAFRAGLDAYKSEKSKS